ncbi:MAG: hypothetical protein ACK5MD_07950 [Flavobacteriales bacterium]
MKSILKITGILTLFTFFIVSCVSSQFKNELPFEVSKATYTITNSLYEINIVSNESITSILSMVYFRDRVSSDIKVNGNQLNILIPRNTKKIVMHKDAEKEYGNTLQDNRNNRFKLGDDELVLSFGTNKNEILYKISVTAK